MLSTCIGPSTTQSLLLALSHLILKRDLQSGSLRCLIPCLEHGKCSKMSNEWANKWMNQWWWHCQPLQPRLQVVIYTGGAPWPRLGAVFHWRPQALYVPSTWSREWSLLFSRGHHSKWCPLQGPMVTLNTYPHFPRMQALSMKAQDCPSRFDFLQSICVWHGVHKQADVPPIIILYTSRGWEKGPHTQPDKLRGGPHDGTYKLGDRK